MLMVTTFIAWAVIDRGRRLLARASPPRWRPGSCSGRVVERVVIRPVEGAPPLNAIIVTLGLLVLLQAVRRDGLGRQPEVVPARLLDQRATRSAAARSCSRPSTSSRCWSSAPWWRARAAVHAHRASGCGCARRRSRRRSRGCSACASAACSRSAGRWPRWPARSPGCSSRRPCSSRPTNSTPCSSSASPRRCSAAWTARRARWSAASLLGLALSYVSGYRGARLVTLGALVDPRRGPAGPPERAVHPRAGEAGMRRSCHRPDAPAPPRDRAGRRGRAVPAQRRARAVRRPAARDDGLLLRRGRRADGADRPQRADLARPRRADGGRRLRGGEDRWATRARAGRSPSRCWPPRWPARSRAAGRRGGGAAARPVPGGRDARARGRAAGARDNASRASSAASNGLTVAPPIPPPALGETFPLERWQAWIACLAALIAYVLLANLVRSGFGRAFRAVRDDEVAAALAGYHVARTQVLAFVVSAGLRRAGRRAARRRHLAGRARARSRSALSVALLTGVILGGLGQPGRSGLGRGRARAGADLGRRRQQRAVAARPTSRRNLALAVYGLVLIGVMLAAPGGVQGVVRSAGGLLRGFWEPRTAAPRSREGGGDVMRSATCRRGRAASPLAVAACGSSDDCGGGGSSRGRQADRVGARASPRHGDRRRPLPAHRAGRAGLQRDPAGRSTRTSSTSTPTAASTGAS